MRVVFLNIGIPFPAFGRRYFCHSSFTGYSYFPYGLLRRKKV
jgi:hypothetical protein